MWADRRQPVEVTPSAETLLEYPKSRTHTGIICAALRMAGAASQLRPIRRSVIVRANYNVLLVTLRNREER